MPLPQPPRVGPPQLGRPGSVTGYMPGAQPYKSNKGADLASGFGMMMQQLVAGDEAKKKQAWDRAQQAIKLKTAGVPVDTQQIMKDLKTAGIQLEKDPKVAQAQLKAGEQTVDQQGIVLGPGSSGGASARPQMPPTPPGGAQPPMGQPGPAGPMGQGGRMGPQQFFDMMGQQGQNKQLMENNQLGLRKQILQLTRKALKGDKEAQAVLRDNGMIPKLTNPESLLNLGKMAGMTEQKTAESLFMAHMGPLIGYMQTAETAAARLGFDQWKQSRDMVNTLMDRYSFISQPMAEAAVAGQFSDDPQVQEVSKKAKEFIFGTPTADQTKFKWDRYDKKTQQEMTKRQFGLAKQTAVLQAVDSYMDNIRADETLFTNQSRALLGVFQSMKLNKDEWGDEVESDESQKAIMTEIVNLTNGLMQKQGLEGNVKLQDIPGLIWGSDPEIRSAGVDQSALDALSQPKALAPSGGGHAPPQPIPFGQPQQRGPLPGFGQLRPPQPPQPPQQPRLQPPTPPQLQQPGMPQNIMQQMMMQMLQGQRR